MTQPIDQEADTERRSALAIAGDWILHNGEMWRIGRRRDEIVDATLENGFAIRSFKRGNLALIELDGWFATWKVEE